MQLCLKNKQNKSKKRQGAGWVGEPLSSWFARAVGARSGVRVCSGEGPGLLWGCSPPALSGFGICQALLASASLRPEVWGRRREAETEEGGLPGAG